MSALKKIGEVLSKLMSSVMGGGSGGLGRGGAGEIDPTQYIIGLQNQTQQFEDLYTDNQPFEKSVCSTLKSCLGIAAMSPGATVEDKFKSAMPEISSKMPDLLKNSGLEKIIGDYTLKNDMTMESRIGDVVSKFTNSDMRLAGMASAFASEIGKYASQAVPQTPLQRAGLVPDVGEISQSLDRENDLKQDKSRELSNGPSIS